MIKDLHLIRLRLKFSFFLYHHFHTLKSSSTVLAWINFISQSQFRHPCSSASVAMSFYDVFGPKVTLCEETIAYTFKDKVMCAEALNLAGKVDTTRSRWRTARR